MFGDDRLNASLRVAARALQIPPRVIDLVLVERQLRLRQLEPVRQSLHGRRCSFGDSRRELGDLRLIRGGRAERLPELVVELRDLRGLRRLLSRRPPHGLGKRQIHFLVGEPQRVGGERPLLRRRRQAHQLLRRDERALIDTERAASGAGLYGRPLIGPENPDRHHDERGDDEEEERVLL